MFLVKRIIGVTCAKNCKKMFTFIKVIQGKLYVFFQTRCTFFSLFVAILNK